MSASPPPVGEARKRKRPNEDDVEGTQDRSSNSSNAYRSQSPRVNTNGAGYGAHGAIQNHGRSVDTSRQTSASPGPTASAVPSPGLAIQQQPQQSASQAGYGYGSPQASSSLNGNGAAAAPAHHPHQQQQPPQAAARSSVPPTASRRERPITKETLEASYFIVEPNDEFTREVGDWLWGWISKRDNVEIEGKIGLLVDNRPGLPPKSRVSFPLGTETILTDATFSRFESNMSLRQHHHFNQILNMRATEAQAPGYTGAPIRYLHTKEIDAFYNSQQTTSGGAAGKTKVRVTRDQATGQIKNDPKASVRKSRIADMNIYSPKRGFDFRISVSVEEPAPIPTSKPTHERWKDRVSYRHQAYQIDLTQVRSTDGKEALHELEIEVSDMPLLMREGEKQARGEENIYYDLVQVFLNNIRMLIRNACPP